MCLPIFHSVQSHDPATLALLYAAGERRASRQWLDWESLWGSCCLENLLQLVAPLHRGTIVAESPDQLFLKKNTAFDLTKKASIQFFLDGVCNMGGGRTFLRIVGLCHHFKVYLCATSPIRKKKSSFAFCECSKKGHTASSSPLLGKRIENVHPKKREA